MGLKLGVIEHEYDKLFPEDMKLYYEILERYLNLTDENFAGAFNLSKISLQMADRFSTLSLDASKLAFSSNVNKTDIKDFLYRKFKIMEYIHVSSRMTWCRGEERGR